MLHIVLSDGTIIDNCLPGTTSDHIIHAGETFEEAATILDCINDNNTEAIQVFNENDEEIASGGSLILIPGATLTSDDNWKMCIIDLRHKTELEVIHEEISELQDAVLE